MFYPARFGFSGSAEGTCEVAWCARLEDRPFSNGGRASNEKPSSNDVACISRQSQPEPLNQMSQTLSYQQFEMFWRHTLLGARRLHCDLADATRLWRYWSLSHGVKRYCHPTADLIYRIFFKGQ